MNRLAGWGLRARLVLAALLGVAAALGLAPYDIWPATLAALLALPALLLASASRWQAAWTGWAFGTGYFAFGLAWIVEPFLVEPERYGWMAPFALAFMAGGLALFWGAAFWAAYWLGHGARARVWALVVMFSLAEFARAYVLTGFPWAALAQIWTDTPVALLLAWIGPHGLALATLLATLPPGLALIRPAPAATRLASGGPALALAAFGLTLGQTQPQAEPTAATVRLIQPNAPQDEKWDPARIPVFFERQVEYTRAATATDARPDLIVWPETAVPTLLEYADQALATIARAADGAPVALGIQRRDEQGRFYNSLVYLDETGAQAGLYDKFHLVPFGEYIPLGDLAARFGLRGLAAREGNGFSAGPGPRLLDFGALGPGLPLICYEAVFPQDIAAAPARPNFLLQITNDAWFGENSGPYQHLAQARMRAIEQGLPLIRAANTGISAVIDPWGGITDSLPLGQAGYIDAALPAPLAPTVYARSGDLPVFLLLLAAALGLWQGRRRGLPRN